VLTFSFGFLIPATETTIIHACIALQTEFPNPKRRNQEKKRTKPSWGKRKSADHLHGGRRWT